MKKKTLGIALVLVAIGFCTNSTADTIIRCKSTSPGVEFQLWPQPYLNEKKQLCFNITSFTGNGCILSNKPAQWSGVSLIYQNGMSFGRDETDFRVRESKVTVDEISYHIEWGRYGTWRTLQRITINRIDGTGVEWMPNEHGGNPIECTAMKRKI